MISSTEIIGCLLGTAVGDALGLPYEGLTPRQQQRLFPHPDRHHLMFGKGMVSDDTEHTCMVARSLIIAAGNPQKFTQDFAWQLRWWLLRLPAGVGLATLRSIVKLWLGFSPIKSGVYSAGNGAAMRSAIIGVCYGDRPDLMLELVRCSTQITHSDPKAEFGAIAVALAAYLSSHKVSIDPDKYYDHLSKIIPSSAIEFLTLIQRVISSIKLGESTPEFAISMGWQRGVSGYVYQTVPIAIHAWLSHQQDYPAAILQVIKCGGDTDTTAAIVGGIVGAGVGKEGIPPKWLKDLCEFPCNISWMEKLGIRLAEVVQTNTKSPALFIPIHLVCLRNLIFLVVVIYHGFRRYFP
jgi:ADP-ribosyl-[dinitrogen reductase] hydrolase